MEITERDPIPKWDFQEPGARLRPWLRELNFWRHDTSTPLQKHGVKLYKSLTIGTAGRSLADQLSAEQICSDWRLSQKYMLKWHCIKRREHRKELLWSSRRASATEFVRWRVVSKGVSRQR